MYFFKRSILMPEQTARAVATIVVFMERLTNFRFVLVAATRADSCNWSRCGGGQFVITMSELALVAVATVACFDPVFAHFCLVFGVVDPPLVDDLTWSFAFAGFATLTLFLPFLRFLLLLQGLPSFQSCLGLLDSSSATAFASSGLLLFLL